MVRAKQLPYRPSKTARANRFTLSSLLLVLFVALPRSGEAKQVKDLSQALNAPFPVSQIVDQAIGGAQQPEVVAATFVAAIKRFNTTDKSKFNQRYRELARGIDGALAGGILKPSKLTRGFQSHRALLGRLDGATVRLRQPGAFLEPLEGGEDLSLPLDALGTLLAASAIDELSRKRLPAAEKFARHLLQMGRLVAGSARTMNELEAAVTMVRKGLTILSVSFVKRKKPALDESERLRPLGTKIAAFGRRLANIRKEMREPSNAETWAKVATANSKLLWQHVALDSLALIARKNPEFPDARKALKRLSQRNDRIGIAAGVRLSRLR